MSVIFNLINKEEERQNSGLELIASENYTSSNVRKAVGSCLTNKYAEGYPNKRYYGGCEFIDEIEQYAINKACELFKCKYANVQPHSGSQANAAAYRALLPEGGKILSLDLNSGGHLTHGASVSFSANLYSFSFYPLDETGHINFELVEQSIIDNKPDLILAGCSAYPYEIDFSKFKELADKYNIKFMVDMAHIAGLVAAGQHMSPIPYADVVTTTTHKTLRGPRGGLILTNDETLAKKINSAIFPYYQGGPLEHVIAGKAICFEEALEPSFIEYINQVKENTYKFSKTLQDLGATCTLTQNHLMLLNTKDSYGITGLEAQSMLEDINITVNKNMLPGDTEAPRTTSGVRIGFAALTTRGCTEVDASIIAEIIHKYLSSSISRDSALNMVKSINSHLKTVGEI